MQEDIIKSQSASEYVGKADGIYSWFRVKTDLSEFHDIKEYLENYLIDFGIAIDWGNYCFENYIGDDNLMIQDDTRRDNGVWQEHKLIIDESEYKIDGQVDEEKRNSLIESHMEKTGCFPSVFRVTQYGDIFPVDTQLKHKKAGAK